MERNRFDDLIMQLTVKPRSRRNSLRLLAGTALTGLLGHAGFAGGETAEAATCKRINRRCRRATQCCSGICRGRRGKKKCRGHGAGTCKQRGQDLYCTAPDPATSICNNDEFCGCLRTTAGTNFCADFVDAGCPSGEICSRCAVCKRDADCVRQGFPRGSACAPVAIGRCGGACKSGTYCMVRCGTVPRTP